MAAMPEQFAIATFHSTHSVLKAEKLLQAAGLTVRLVPVPSRLSSDCGVSVRFPAAGAATAVTALRPLQDDLEGVFIQHGEGWERFPPG